MRVALAAVLVVLAGCGASFSATRWDNTKGPCDLLDNGGLYTPKDFCRCGKGILVSFSWMI